jgi:hypothetical protein
MTTIAKCTMPIEHIRIQPTKSFTDVRAALERTVPELDPTVLELLANGEIFSELRSVEEELAQTNGVLKGKLR